MFGHVRRLQESVPVHEALRLAVNTRTGVRPDDRLDWKRPRGRPRHTWIRQLEIDVGLAAAAAWDMASDREVWRAQRPVAGQAVQWVSEWLCIKQLYSSILGRVDFFWTSWVVILRFEIVTVLSHNKISEIDVATLSQLVKLQLSHNKLKTFPDVRVWNFLW